MTFTHLTRVLGEVEQLGQLFADEGFRLFLVGGIVRDQWLDEPLDASSDIDLTTDARPADIKRIVAPFADDLWTQGERFGTIGLRADGRDYEVTTHRAESYASESRKPTVSFGDDIAVDLSRRDFTVNAMAIELPGGELVDPFGGAVDLEARVLRTPLSAEISFSDDPLRMLRAARFSTKYSLAPVDELTASATRLHERVRIVAIERIGVELQRLLGLEQAAQGVRFLADAGLLAEVLAYGETSMIDRVKPRLDAAVQATRDLPPTWQLRLAGIGLAVFADTDGVYAMCRRLRLSRDDERQIVGMTKAAVDVQQMADLSAPSLRRWLMDHGSTAWVAEGIILAGWLLDETDLAAFIQAREALVAAEDTEQVSFIDGDTIMETLGITPGPAIGQAHAFLRDCYFEAGPLDPAEQVTRLQTWWARQS